jgi:hypothetical protein
MATSQDKVWADTCVVAKKACEKYWAAMVSPATGSTSFSTYPNLDSA